MKLKEGDILIWKIPKRGDPTNLYTYYTLNKEYKVLRIVDGGKMPGYIDVDCDIGYSDFYFGEIYDYFYTDKELRKLKLERINK